MYMYICTCMDTFKKNMLCLYITNIYIYINYMNRNIYMYIFSKFILRVCVCVYIHNTYTQYSHIHYVNKNLFWMRLMV